MSQLLPSSSENHSGLRPSAKSATSSPRLSQYLTVLRRKWWLVLCIMALTLGGAIAYIKLAPPVFKSEAVMWVTGSLQLPDGAHYNEDVQTFFGTQLELLQSDSMVDRTVKRLKAQDPSLVFPKDEKGQLVVPKLKIMMAPRSAVFNLECRDTNGALAQSFLNGLMDEYLAYKGEVRTATSGGALASVSEQVYKQEQELKNEQDRLNAFQRSNNVALLENDFRDGSARLSQLKMQLDMTKLELQLIEAAAIEQTNTGGFATNLLSNAPDPRRALNSQSANGATLPVDFVTAYQQLKSLKVQREQLGRYMKEQHPKMVKLNQDIALAEKVIEYFRQQSLEQLNTSKQALVIRIQSLEEAIKALETSVGAANVSYAELDKIKANITRLQGFEDRLLTLLQGVDINRNVSQENVTILERATDPLPTLPLRVLAGIFLLGSAITFGLIYRSALSDDRFETLEALRGYFNEEIVGQVPEVKIKKRDKKSALITPNDPRHILIESFRNLRSSLLYWPLEKAQLKTLLITSAVPDEGKSTVAVNLARILAMGGSRVLLIDGDLRCGTLNEVLGLSVEPGLTEYLTKGGNSKQYVLNTDLKNLSFIPRGHRVPDSSDFFVQQPFNDLLAWAKAEYDYTIVDCVPVFAADDAVTIAPKIDGVLFVTRSGSSRAKLAHQALELLYQRQSNVLGLVFNRASTATGNYGYYKHAKYHTNGSAVKGITA